MIRKTFFSLFLTVCLANCSFSIEPGDRIVVRLNGELVAGKIVELISADSKAVIKLIDGKTIITLTDDIAYGLPPLIDDSQVREWNIDKRENATIASFIRMKDDIVYLQKKDGIVISFQTTELSQPDLSFAREKSRSQSKVLLSAGDAIKIMISTSPPVESKEVRKALAASLERSGYVVSEDASTQLKVDFQREKTQKKMMSGLNGDREIWFTPTKARVTLIANGALLHDVTYVTKPPFSLPAGEEGEKILREAEVFVFPFLRSVALSPRFEMAK